MGVGGTCLKQVLLGRAQPLAHLHTPTPQTQVPLSAPV